VKALSSRKLAVAAVGLVLLGGGAAAVAATHSSSGLGRQGYIDDLAKHLGVSPGALAAAMRAAGDEQIEAAVAAGRITQSQADVLKQRAGRRGGAPLLGYGFAAGRLGPGGAAAQYLGINRATLRSERLAAPIGPPAGAPSAPAARPTLAPIAGIASRPTARRRALALLTRSFDATFTAPLVEWPPALPWLSRPRNPPSSTNGSLTAR